jgi:hypothetical protein
VSGNGQTSSGSAINYTAPNLIVDTSALSTGTFEVTPGVGSITLANGAVTNAKQTLSTVSGTAISTTNKIVDATAFDYRSLLDTPTILATPYPPNVNFTVVNNRLYLQRIVPTRTMTITHLAISVATAATSNDACDIGIYDLAGGGSGIGNRIASTGSATSRINTAGPLAVALTASVTLNAGTAYYLAFVSAVGGTGAILTGVSFVSSNFVPVLDGSQTIATSTTAGNPNRQFMFLGNGSATLPSTVTWSSCSLPGGFPLVVARTSA